MSKHALAYVLTVVAMLAVAAPIYAKPLTTTINFPAVVTVGNSMLAPGNYQVTADKNQARFEIGGKLVAAVPCTLKSLDKKAEKSSFATDRGGTLTEIEVGGQKQAIEFAGS